MNNPSLFAIALLARSETLKFERLAEVDAKQWTVLILALAILAGIVCFLLYRTGQWRQLAAWLNSFSAGSLAGALIGVAIPVLLANFLGIAEYLLFVVLGGYLGAALASRVSPDSASLHAAVAAILIALSMSVRAYYVAVDKTSPGAIFPPWVFFVPAVFVAAGLAAMLAGAILFAPLARRRTSGDAIEMSEIPKKEPVSLSDYAPLAANKGLRAALMWLILFISLGGLAWQTARYASEHRTLRRLNEYFWNTASRSDQIGIRVRWSQGKRDDSWWLELFRIRLGGSRLPRIKRLIGNNLADDEALEALSVLPNLADLDLQEAKITDAGLVHLQNLPNLRMLNLGQNDVSDEAVAALQKQLPQAEIKVSRPPRSASR